MTAHSIEDTVDRLLAVLDEDIRHVGASLAQLDQLRSLLIKRDDKALERLLRDLQAQARTRTANEQRRQHLRGALAAALGCNIEDLTLSKLQAELAGSQVEALADRQRQLKALVVDLKREHRLTTMLLSDCSRFNRSLMRLFFGSNAVGSTTYSASGRAQSQNSVGLMNMQF